MSAMKPGKAWALKGPDGKLHVSTVAPTKSECWTAGFWVASDSIPNNAQGQRWGDLFWKKWDPSIRSAEKHGFKMVRVALVEAKPPRRTHKIKHNEE